MRRTAMLLALFVALLDLTIYVVDEIRLSGEVGSVLDLGFGAFLSRLMVTLTFSVPWIVGALLLWRRRRGLGAAVLVPSALLAIPGVVFLVGRGMELVTEGAAIGPWSELTGGLATWLLAVAAGWAAWLARPRGALRLGAPGRGNAYVVLAFLAWLPTILASTQFVMPGSEGTPEGARHFYEFIWDTAGGLGAVVGVTEAVLFGALLLLGPSLRRDMAGAMVLVVVLPALLVEVQTILTVARESFMISTPASYLGTAGLLGLGAIGVVWLARGAPTPPEAAPRDDAAPEPTASPEEPDT